MNRWYDSFKYKPKHGTQVFFWNREKHREEFLNAFWDESAWNAFTLPDCFAPIWRYVFEGLDPLEIQPERPNPNEHTVITNDLIGYADSRLK